MQIAEDTLNNYCILNLRHSTEMVTDLPLSFFCSEIIWRSEADFFTFRKFPNPIFYLFAVTDFNYFFCNINKDWYFACRLLSLKWGFSVGRGAQLHNLNVLISICTTITSCSGIYLFNVYLYRDKYIVWTNATYHSTTDRSSKAVSTWI